MVPAPEDYILSIELPLLPYQQPIDSVFVVLLVDSPLSSFGLFVSGWHESAHQVSGMCAMPSVDTDHDVTISSQLTVSCNGTYPIWPKKPSMSNNSSFSSIRITSSFLHWCHILFLFFHYRNNEVLGETESERTWYGNTEYSRHWEQEGRHLSK